MDFIDTLLSLDTNLFLLINGFHCAYMDKFMSVFSDKLVWIPFYLAIIFEIYRSKKKESTWIILALILCVVLADQISSSIIKEAVHRFRPSRNENLQNLIHIVNGYKGGKYGFVSSHAANTIGLALLSSLIFKNRLYSYIVFIWVGITSYSRIYLGVHYPADVLGGFIVGVFAALLCFGLLKRYKPHLVDDFKSITFNKLTLSSLVLIVSVFSIAIYSFIS